MRWNGFHGQSIVYIESSLLCIADNEEVCMELIWKCEQSQCGSVSGVSVEV